MAIQLLHKKESIFQSRLARRIFFNFIASALIPLTATVVIVFYQVTYEMERQTRAVLDREIKSMVLGLFERLMMQQMQLEVLTASITKGLPDESRVLEESFRRWFKAAAVMDMNSGMETIYSYLAPPPELNSTQRAHLAEGKTAVVIDTGEGSDARILLTRQAMSEPNQHRYIWVEADTDHLWDKSITKHLPYGSQACLFDDQGRTIYSSFAFPKTLKQTVKKGVRKSDRGNFDLSINGEAYSASFRKLPLKLQFMAQDWSVVLVQQKYELARTIEKFKSVFPMVILIAMGSVVLLSINMIRSSLGPLKSLIQGTGRIAQKDFGCRIEVNSKDEFNDLAWAFNDMSAQLDQQFRAMTARSDVDRAILSFLDKESIVAAIIGGIDKILHCHRIGIGILDWDTPDTLQTFHQTPVTGDAAEIVMRRETVQPDELTHLLSWDEQVMTFEGVECPFFLKPYKPPEISYLAVLPVRVKQRVAAFIVLGYRDSPPECKDHFEQARKMADHMAVAMANAMLVKDLNQSHWGALHALARAVDAKSSWTAGHSERVARTALRIGRALGLDEAELNHLHRGALLHDLGKIGVPAAILEKNSELTEGEFAKIKSHPAIGARILEPIVAFKEVVPMIEQHHERYDGKGYPYGLAGEAIDWGARILSVADVFDALLSDRPYRKGWSEKKVLKVIEKGAGSKFDPNIVTIFMTEMAQPTFGHVYRAHGLADGKQINGDCGDTERLPSMSEAKL